MSKISISLSVLSNKTSDFSDSEPGLGSPKFYGESLVTFPTSVDPIMSFICNLCNETFKDKNQKDTHKADKCPATVYSLDDGIEIKLNDEHVFQCPCTEVACKKNYRTFRGIQSHYKSLSGPMQHAVVSSFTDILHDTYDLNLSIRGSQ